MDNLLNELTNRDKNWYDTMPHSTEESLKFRLDRLKLTPVRGRQKSYSETDIRTHRQTDCPPIPLFSTFRWWLFIPNPVLSKIRFLARCQNFLGVLEAMEVTWYSTWKWNAYCMDHMRYVRCLVRSAAPQSRHCLSPHLDEESYNEVHHNVWTWDHSLSLMVWNVGLLWRKNPVQSFNYF